VTSDQVSRQTRLIWSVSGFSSLAGFSFGAGFKIKQFRIDYGHQVYHIAGGVNHIGISTSFQEFKK